MRLSKFQTAFMYVNCAIVSVLWVITVIKIVRLFV